MITQICVITVGEDPRQSQKQSQIVQLGLSTSIQVTGLIDVYTIQKKFSAAELKEIADILHEPVSQRASLNSYSAPNFSWAIEIGFLPGVTDNVATTIKDAITDFTKLNFAGEEGVWTSQIMFVEGKLTAKEVETIANSFANPLIQRIAIKSAAQFKKDGKMDVVVPAVKLHATAKIQNVALDISDEELIKIGKQGVANPDGSRRGPLALDFAYMKAIQTYFQKLGRQPNDIEVESIAQTWSEHCKHTIFADPIDEIKEGLFKKYIRGATQKIRQKKGKKDICASVFTDNSGALFFDDEYLITDKVETHNSPSALDPFGGAITGIVGVNRDAMGFGLGAKPILNRYGFCFAPPDDQTVLYRDAEQKQPLLSARRIMDGVVAGVNSGGNCSGIPTPQGFVYFDPRYRGKPLVFVGTVGLIPRQKNGQKLFEKQAKPGDYIVVAGGRVGLDGIHGATFSSESLNSGSPATAVQIGDPITQKKLSDVMVKEARDQHLYNSVTDNGAGGLSCSVAEMAKECGGFMVDLEKVPLKYPGLEPWQIWISESQERMTFAVPPKKWSALQKLLAKRGVEAAVIGTFTKTPQCIVNYHGKKIMDMTMEFLHEGLPARQLQSTYHPPKIAAAMLPKKIDFNALTLKLLAQLSIASTAFLSQQYDHEVQGTSVLKPLQGKGRVNADSSVIQPLPTSPKGVAVSQALFPSLSELNPKIMSAVTIDTAIRNLVAIGVDPQQIALLDNFCWCSANEPERLGQLKLAVRACYDYAVAYGTPFISGKDSMFNDFNGYDAKGKKIKISVPPTLLISSLAVVNNVQKVISLDAKMAGNLVYVLGETNSEIGGSEILRTLGVDSGQLPVVHAAKNLKLYQKYFLAVQKDLVASAISIGRGGLITALAKMTLAGQLGANISLRKLKGKWSTPFMALGSESQGRLLVTVAPAKQKQFEKMLNGLPVSLIGTITQESQLKISDKQGKPLVSLELGEMHKAYSSTFPQNAGLQKPPAKKALIPTARPRTLVLTGYGINCEEETAYAFEKAGSEATIFHINDLIDQPNLLKKNEILAIPGGFSFGDDTGSGNAFAQKLKHALWDELLQFVEQDHLVIGICNGCQILVNLGLFPTMESNYGQRQIALLHNENPIYSDRWVDICVENDTPWLQKMITFSLPIAHGEGKFFAAAEVLDQLENQHQVAGRFIPGEVCQHFNLPTNPNGALHNIAAITDPSGRVFGIMPHPERAVRFTQLPHWTFLREQRERQGQTLPAHGPGLQIFQNAVRYFQGNP